MDMWIQIGCTLGLHLSEFNTKKDQQPSKEHSLLSVFSLVVEVAVEVYGFGHVVALVANGGGF